MQNKFLSWLSLFAFLASFIAQAAAQGTAPAASTQAVGKIKIANVQGVVTAQRTDNNATIALSNGMEITQGNIVRTGANSSVVLLFSNGATVNLAFDSELNIETFTQDPFAEQEFKPSTATEEPSKSTTSLRLARGELVGKVLKLKPGPNNEPTFKVSTPVGAAGIRGTTFRITYRPTGDGRNGYTYTMTTVEGTVEVVIASGTVTGVTGTQVTESKEIVLTNVEVNATTNQITAETPTGQVVTVATAPPSGDAPVSTLTAVQNVAAQLVTAVAQVVFTSPTPPTNTNPPGNNPPTNNPPPQDNPTPGTTTQTQTGTNPR